MFSTHLIDCAHCVLYYKLSGYDFQVGKCQKGVILLNKMVLVNETK